MSTTRTPPADAESPRLDASAETTSATDRLESQLVVAAFARVRPIALGLSMGIVAAALFFAATAILLFQAAGDPAPENTGYHLSLLGQFLPGYDVTWPGAVLALIYGFGVGAILGAILGWLLNLSHAVYVRIIVRGMRSGVLQDAL